MAIKLRTQVKHPSRVEGGAGIVVQKKSGAITVGLDLAMFSETALISDQSTASILLVTPGGTDNAPDVVERITVEDFAATLEIPESIGLPSGYIGERRVEINGADSDHDVDFYPFSARDTTNSTEIVAPSTITKRIDANWSAGSGGGGLDAGAVANNTWYYCHRIRRSDTGGTDALLSISSTAPTLPANYDSFQLQGAVLTNGSANLVPFTYVNGIYYLTTAALDHNVTLGTTPTSYALRVPRIQGVTSIFAAYGFLGGAASVSWTIVPGFLSSGIANAGYTISQEVSGLGGAAVLHMQVNGSGQVAAVCTAAGSTFHLRTRGWYF